MNAEKLAWEIVRLVVDGYDDCGIVIHGRIYNQGDVIKLDFVSAVHFVQFAQDIPRAMLQTKQDAISFADAICEARIPEYYTMVKEAVPANAPKSLYSEMWGPSE